jgi:hypothetical protein
MCLLPFHPPNMESAHCARAVSKMIILQLYMPSRMPLQDDCSKLLCVYVWAEMRNWRHGGGTLFSLLSIRPQDAIRPLLLLARRRQNCALYKSSRMPLQDDCLKMLHVCVKMRESSLRWYDVGAYQRLHPMQHSLMVSAAICMYHSLSFLNLPHVLL